MGGRGMCPNMPYKWLQGLCEKNDLPFYGIHSLRHFYASALINANVDAATVSSALGHSVITTTVNTQKGHTRPVQPYSTIKTAPRTCGKQFSGAVFFMD